MAKYTCFFAKKLKGKLGETNKIKDFSLPCWVTWEDFLQKNGTLFLRGIFSPSPGIFFRLSSRRLVCKGSKAASKQGSKDGSQRASKQASQPASKQARGPASKASKQASKRANQPTNQPTNQPSKQASKGASKGASEQTIFLRGISVRTEVVTSYWLYYTPIFIFTYALYLLALMERKKGIL